MVELVSSPLPQLQALNGAHLERITGRGDQSVAVDASLLHRSPRWSVDDATRAAASATRSNACRRCSTRAP